jgi:hypothetical protein
MHGGKGMKAPLRHRRAESGAQSENLTCTIARIDYFAKVISERAPDRRARRQLRQEHGESNAAAGRVASAWQRAGHKKSGQTISCPDGHRCPTALSEIVVRSNLGGRTVEHILTTCA